MRPLWLTAAIALAGCGGHHHRPPSPRATAVAEHAHGAWSRPVAGAAAVRPAATLRREQGWFTWASDAVPGAAAAIETDVADRYRVRVAVRDRTITLVEVPSESNYPPLQDVAIAADGRGRTLVAWAEEHRVRALFIRRDGSFGVAHTLGRADGVSTLAAGFAPGGHAVVAWGTHDGGEELNQPNRILAATRDGGAAGFAPALELDRGRIPTRATPHLALAVTPGSALLDWNVVARRGHATVRAARAGARGRFGEPVALGEGTPGAVALRPDGAALVSWTQDYRAYAAVARPGALLGRAEPVSDADRAFALRAGFDASGRPRLTWTTHRPPQARYAATRSAL